MCIFGGDSKPHSILYSWVCIFGVGRTVVPLYPLPGAKVTPNIHSRTSLFFFPFDKKKSFLKNKNLFNSYTKKLKRAVRVSSISFASENTASFFKD